VGGDRTILHTSDGGATWQEKLGGDAFDYHQAIHFVDETHGWTCTFYGDVYHTTDGGLTWTKQIDTYLDLQDIHFTDRMHGISVGGVDGNATLLTDDGGVTWVDQDNPENAYLNGVTMVDTLTGIAVGQGIFRTFDGAVTWERDDSYSTYLDDVCILGQGVALVVGRGGAILRAGAAGPSLVEGMVPAALLEVKGWPNPFNAQTTVSFSLPTGWWVDVRVFDLNGRRVRRLAGREFPAGDHAVAWDGRDDAGRALASGSYLIQVESGGKTGTSKAVLVK
jgi:photosystem II stability/assembly factor-like uncharacterized protein